MSRTAEHTPVAEFSAVENANLTVADAVWVGMALLHKKHPNQSQFTIQEIVASVESHHLTKGMHKSIEQHVRWHCVANREPRPNRTRMLFAMRDEDDPNDTHRRIFIEGDRWNPARKGSPTRPSRESLPAKYVDLIDWIADWGKRWHAANQKNHIDPLLDLIGTGRGMWNGLSPDDYVASLREGWEDRQ